MAINLDKLPDNPSQYTLIEPGIYRAKITKAQMQSPGGDRKDFLALTLDIKDKKNTSLGLVQDRLYDSDKPAIQYKIKRLIVDALALNLTGMVELKDLAKVIPNREVCVELDRGSYTKNDKIIYTTEVKMFDTEIYWPINMYPS